MIASLQEALGKLLRLQMNYKSILEKALPLTGAAVEAVAAHHLGKPTYVRQRRILDAINPDTAALMYPNEALPVSTLEERLTKDDPKSKRPALQLLTPSAVHELSTRKDTSSSDATFHSLAKAHRQTTAALRGPDTHSSSRAPAQPFRAASVRPSQASGGSSSRAPPPSRTKPRKPASERNAR
jgi:hypothetical protein